MKNVLFTIALLVGAISFAQKKQSYNTNKEGVVLNGYDVVSYFNGTPLMGKPKYAYQYDGATFYFTGKFNLKRFKKRPEKFVPQYGGWCSYAVAKNYTYKANPTSYVISKKKLYLFYPSTVKRWKKDQKNMIASGNKNWEAWGK